MAEKVVYLITNKLNGKMYVGQASDYLRRLRQYRYAAKPSSKVKFLNDVMKVMRKDGFENFEFSILKRCETFEELDAYEKHFIDKFGTKDPHFGYNYQRGGGSKREGMWKHKVDYHMSTEEKLKRSKKIIVYHKGAFTTYPSAKEFADIMGCDKSIISSSIRNGKKYHKHLIYYYDDAKRAEYVEKNLSKNNAKKMYCEIGRYLNSVDVETIENVAYLTISSF